MATSLSPNSSPCILLATDLSARSDRALDRAVQLAQQRQARLVALHVMEPSAAKSLGAPPWRRSAGDHRELAERRLRDDLAGTGVAAEMRVETGKPHEVIGAMAAELGCELIVSGVARDETLGRLLLGSTVEKLVRQSETPTLVVRRRCRGPYRKAVVATDFSEGSRHALLAAHRLLPGTALTLFHAFETPLGRSGADSVQSARAEAETAARQFVSATPELAGAEPPECRIEHGPPATLLSEYACAQDLELAVVGTHGLTGLLRTAIGSVAESLLESLPCDVLVVRQTHAQDLREGR